MRIYTVAMPTGYKLVISRALGMHGIYCPQPSGTRPSGFGAINAIHPSRPSLYYIQRKIFFRRSFFLYSPCHYMRAWIRVLDAPGCYERAALQGSGLVRTVGPCAQRRVALMPRAIATARDALSNDRRESAVRWR